MQLEWSVFALADRDAIFDFIETDSPRTAIAVDDRMQISVENLAQFPEMGRPGRIEGTRELVVSAMPYIVVYRIVDGIVQILRILHGAQQWPEATSDEPE